MKAEEKIIQIQKKYKRQSSNLRTELELLHIKKDKEIWDVAQQDRHNEITQLLMNQGIIYRNGYGFLCSDLKPENLGDRLKAFCKKMDGLETIKV